MSENEYKELIDFLGKKFEKIDDRFENIDKKFENIDKKFDNIDKKFDNIDNKFYNIDNKFERIDTRFEDLRREMGVLHEDVLHKIDIVAEGVIAVSEKLDRFHDENEQKHARLEKMTLVNTADISSLDHRVVRLEGKSSPR